MEEDRSVRYREGVGGGRGEDSVSQMFLAKKRTTGYSYTTREGYKAGRRDWCKA